jgi:glycosyltransferase involved in cell wall biosynthesis
MNMPGIPETRPVVILLGPSREAVSGVSTHLNLLFGSALARQFDLVHFQVGSQGRVESRVRRAARLLASPFLLAAAIVRRNAAIVHVNTSLDRRAYWRDLAYVAVSKLCGARVVYQVHGGALPAEFFAGSRLLTAWLRTTLGWPDALVVLASLLAEAYRALVPGQSVALIPNGIDSQALLNHRPRYARQDRPLGLLYIGRLVATKGLFESFQALAAGRRLGVQARLVVAGDGPEEARMRARVHELGLDEVVSFAGPVFGDRKARLLDEADVLLLPTYHAEGLPYALLEGMAAGLVPIVTRVGAIPDVVRQDLHAQFVAPRDPAAITQAIAVLHRDRARLARMSAACRSRVAAAYTVERVAAGFAALYAGLRGARAPQPVR